MVVVSYFLFTNLCLQGISYFRATDNDLYALRREGVQVPGLVVDCLFYITGHNFYSVETLRTHQPLLTYFSMSLMYSVKSTRSDMFS